MGVDVILVGPLPTPGIAYITRSLRADAGIVISASHNSFEDNGIKFFSGDGLKLPDAREAEIEDMMATARSITSGRPPTRSGRRTASTMRSGGTSSSPRIRSRRG